MFSRFAKGVDGAAAIEFAMVAPVFFLMLFATMELALKTLMQSQLDHVMFKTAMQLTIEEDLNVSKADYKQTIVCPSDELILLNCDEIQFGVSALPTNHSVLSPGFLSRSFVGEWTTGCGGSNLVIEFLYPMPDIFLPFGIVDSVEHQGENHMRSRGMARREPVLVGSGSHDGGSGC